MSDGKLLRKVAVSLKKNILLWLITIDEHVTKTGFIILKLKVKSEK